MTQSQRCSSRLLAAVASPGANGNSPEDLNPYRISQNQVDLRTAAYVVAVGRVAQTAMERGIWP